MVTADFFVFGIGNGDKVGPQEIDATTEAISMAVPISFFLAEYRDLYVCNVHEAPVCIIMQP